MASNANDSGAEPSDSDEEREANAPEQTAENSSSSPTLYDTVNFSPNKADIYIAIKSDVDVEEAFLELFDNVFDNWERVSEKTDALRAEVFLRVTDDGEQELVIRDNSGGVRRDELDMLFALGRSAKDEVSGSVGAFGVGLKAAILRLGDEATIATRHKGAETGYGFTVDREWLDEDGWERPVEEFDLPAGVTEIRLRRLNFNFSNKIEDLKDTLESTYEIFLGGGPRPDIQDYDFELRVGDETLPREDDWDVNWAYPPFDGLHPRQFRNIELDSREASEPVKLHVTVGLLQEARMDESGSDVFVQNRKVHDAVKNEQGGFGVTRYMGQFKDSQHKRLKIIVEMETEGDARDLPWTSSKNMLDLDSQIAQQAFNWVGRIAEPYYNATYQAFPQTLLRPYGEGNPHAVAGNLGADAFDFSGRDNVTGPYKPTEGYPTAKQVMKVATAHARLGVKAPSAVDEPYGPAYEEHWDDQFDRSYGEHFRGVGVLPVILDSDPRFDVKDINEIVSRIDGYAKADARADQRYDGLEDWEQPRYEATLRQNLPDGLDPATLTLITERPNDDEGNEGDGVDESDEGDGIDAPGEGVDDPSSEAGDDSEHDRTEYTIASTPEQVELFEAVLDLPDGFEEASPADRSDKIEERLDRLRAVLEIAGGGIEARGD